MNVSWGERGKSEADDLLKFKTHENHCFTVDRVVSQKQVSQELYC